MATFALRMATIESTLFAETTHLLAVFVMRESAYRPIRSDNCQFRVESLHKTPLEKNNCY